MAKKDNKDKIEKLKAKGYDVMATIQNHELQAEALKQELNKIAAQITELRKPEAVKET